MPQITANISDPETVKKARRLALDAGVSLRNWAGEILEKHLNNNRTRLRKGPKLKDQ